MSWQEFTPVSLGVDPPPSLQGDIVGGDTALTYSDGDTGYVETYNSGSTDAETCAFRLSPTPSGTFTRIKAAAEFRTLDNVGGVVLAGYIADELQVIGLQPTSPAAVGSYVTHEWEFDFSLLPARYTPTAFMAAPYWILSSWSMTGSSARIRTTWLRIYGWGGARPLQWKGRTDGLGVGEPRQWRGLNTVQSTNMGRGMV